MNTSTCPVLCYYLIIILIITHCFYELPSFLSFFFFSEIFFFFDILNEWKQFKMQKKKRCYVTDNLLCVIIVLFFIFNLTKSLKLKKKENKIKYKIKCLHHNVIELILQ